MTEPVRADSVKEKLLFAIIGLIGCRCSVCSFVCLFVCFFESLLEWRDF